MAANLINPIITGYFFNCRLSAGSSLNVKSPKQHEKE
jgi:hypothetical protein